MKKFLLALVLTGISALNVIVLSPWSASACTCFSNGQIKCIGDCCGGVGGQCDCFNKGTDNCKALLGE